MTAAHDDEALLCAADESFLSGVDVDDFLFVLLDSLQPSVAGGATGAAGAGAAGLSSAAASASATPASASDEDPILSGLTQHLSSSSSRGPPLLEALRETWRPQRLLCELLHPCAAAAGAPQKKSKALQQPEKSQVQAAAALNTVEVQLSCPLKSWGLVIGGEEEPLYASCLSAAASLLSYGETQTSRVALAIKAFLEVRPATKDHQVALLLLLRLLIFRWAVCQRLSLPSAVRHRLAALQSGAGKLQVDPQPAVSVDPESAAAPEAAAIGDASSARAEAEDGKWLTEVIVFAIREASALAEGDERGALLLEVLQIAARCAPHIVLSKLLKAAKKAALLTPVGRDPDPQDAATGGAACCSVLVLLTKVLASSGWPSIPLSLTRQIFVVLLQLLLLPLHHSDAAATQQQGREQLSLPIRWGISVKAAEALSAYAAAAALGNCRALLQTLQRQQEEQQQQQQDSDREALVDVVRLQRALHDGLAAAAAAAAASARGEGNCPPGGDGGCGIECLPLMAAAAERLVYILLPRMLLARAPPAVISALLRAASMLLLLPVHLSSPLMLRLWDDEHSGLVRPDPVLLLLQLLLLHITSEMSGFAAADLLQEDQSANYRASAAAAAAASTRDQRKELQKQRQKLMQEGWLEAAATAAAGPSAAAAENATHVSATAAYRQRLQHDASASTVELDETTSNGNSSNGDSDLGDGVRLEGPRAAAFFLHVAASLSQLSELLAERQQYWRLRQHAAELQQMLLLLLLHASRRSLSPKDPLGDELADETIERLIEPIVSATVASLSAVQLQHEARTAGLTEAASAEATAAAATDQPLLPPDCPGCLVLLSGVTPLAAPAPAAAAVAAACCSGAAAPPYLQQIDWLFAALDNAAAVARGFADARWGVPGGFGGLCAAPSFERWQDGPTASHLSPDLLLSRSVQQQQQQQPKEGDIVRFAAEGLARFFGLSVCCKGSLALSALNSAADIFAAASHAMKKTRGASHDLQQHQQLCAVQCAAAIFISKVAETQRCECPPPVLALAPWQLPSEPCNCVAYGETAVSLRLPEEGQQQRQQQFVQQSLEEQQQQQEERRRSRGETAARLVTCLFSLAAKSGLTPPQAAVVLCAFRSLSFSRLLQAAAVHLIEDEDEELHQEYYYQQQQQIVPRQLEVPFNSDQQQQLQQQPLQQQQQQQQVGKQQQRRRSSGGVGSIPSEFQLSLNFNLPLLRASAPSVGWKGLTLVDPADSSSSSEEEAAVPRRLPRLRRQVRKYKKDIPQPAGWGVVVNEPGPSTAAEAQEVGAGAAVIGRPKRWRRDSVSDAASGGAAWWQNPPACIRDLFVFVVRLLALAPPSDLGESGSLQWLALSLQQQQGQQKQLLQTLRSPAVLLRDAAGLVLFKVLAHDAPDLLFPVLIECLGMGPQLRPALPSVCSCLALLSQRSVEADTTAAAEAAAAGAAAAAAAGLLHSSTDRLSLPSVLSVSPAVPQAQAAALCLLLQQAADIHSDRGGLAAAALHALAELIPVVLPSTLLLQQQQQTFVSGASMLHVPSAAASASQQQQQQLLLRSPRPEAASAASSAVHAKVFVSALAESLEEHAGGALPLSFEGWLGALCELLLLLHSGLLANYSNNETQQLFVSCCLLRGFSAAAAATRKDVELADTAEMQLQSSASSSLGGMVSLENRKLATAKTAALHHVQQQQRVLAAVQFMGVIAHSFPALSVQQNLLRVFLGCGKSANASTAENAAGAEEPPALWLFLARPEETQRGTTDGGGLLESLLLLSRGSQGAPLGGLTDLNPDSSSSSEEESGSQADRRSAGSSSTVQVPRAAIAGGIRSKTRFAPVAAAAAAVPLRYCHPERLRRVVGWLASSGGALWLQECVQPLMYFAADGAQQATTKCISTDIALIQEQRTIARAVALTAGSSSNVFAFTLKLLQSLGAPPAQKRAFGGFPFFSSSASKQQTEGARVLLLLCRAALGVSPPPDLVRFSQASLVAAAAAAATAAAAASSNSEAAAALAAAAASASATGGERPLGTWLFGGGPQWAPSSIYSGFVQQARQSVLGVFYTDGDAFQLSNKLEAFLAATAVAASATQKQPQQQKESFFLFASLMLSLTQAFLNESNFGLALTLAETLHLMALKCRQAAQDLLLLEQLWHTADNVSVSSISSCSSTSAVTAAEADARAWGPSLSASGLSEGAPGRSSSALAAFAPPPAALLMPRTQWVERHCRISLRCSSMTDAETSAAAAALHRSDSINESSFSGKQLQHPVDPLQQPLLRGPLLLPRVFSESKRNNSVDTDVSASAEDMLMAAAAVGDCIGRAAELVVAACLPHCLEFQASKKMPPTAIKVSAGHLKQAADAWNSGINMLTEDPLVNVEEALGLDRGSSHATTGSATSPTGAPGENAISPLSIAAFRCAAAVLPIRPSSPQQQQQLAEQQQRVGKVLEELQIHRGLCCMLLTTALNTLRSLMPPAAAAFVRGVYVRALGSPEASLKAAGVEHMHGLLQLHGVPRDSRRHHRTPEPLPARPLLLQRRLQESQKQQQQQTQRRHLSPHGNHAVTATTAAADTQQQQRQDTVDTAASALGDSCGRTESLKALLTRPAHCFAPSAAASAQVASDLHRLAADAQTAAREGFILEIPFDVIAQPSDPAAALAASASEALLALSRHHNNWQTTALLLRALHLRLCSTSSPFLRWRGLRACRDLILASPSLPDNVEQEAREVSSSSNSKNSRDMHLWVQSLLLLFPKGGDGCLQVATLAMEAFAALVAKAPQGRAAARAAAAITASAADTRPSAADDGFSQPAKCVFVDAQGSRASVVSATTPLPQQKPQHWDSGRSVSASSIFGSVNVQERLEKQQQELLQQQQLTLLAIIRPFIAGNPDATKETVSLLLLPLAYSVGSAAFAALKCLTELLCSSSAAGTSKQHHHPQGEQQHQADEVDPRPISNSQEQHHSIPSINNSVLHTVPIVRRVSRALFSMLPVRQSRLEARRASLQRLSQRLIAVAVAAGYEDIPAAVSTAAAAAAAAAGAPTFPRAAPTRARCEAHKDGDASETHRGKDEDRDQDGTSDFAVAALEYEAQTFWLHLVEQEERRIEAAAVNCLRRLSLINFEAVLDPLTCYPQPLGDSTGVAAAAAAAETKLGVQPSSPTPGGKDHDRRHLAASERASPQLATKHLAAALLDPEEYNETATAATAVRWRGDCCFGSSCCIHRAFASCVAKDKALAALYISHTTNVCNSLGTTTEVSNAADFNATIAGAAAEPAAVAARAQEALVQAAAPAQHQATLLLLLLLQHEQRRQQQTQKSSFLGRMLQRHSAPLLGTALLRIGMAHAAVRIRHRQQQTGRGLKILGQEGEVVSWNCLKDQMDLHPQVQQSDGVSPKRQRHHQQHFIPFGVAAAAELLVSVAVVTGHTEALAALDGANFLERATRSNEYIGAIHDAALLFGAACPSLLPTLIPFLAPFCCRALLVYRHSAVAALQGAVAALHVVNLTPSAYLSVSDECGNRYILGDQQQQQGTSSSDFAAAPSASDAAAPTQQQQQHVCGGWASLLPGGFLSSLASSAAVTAPAEEETRTASKKQESTVLPAQRMQRLLAVATDAAVDAAAMTLEDLQPQVVRLERALSPGSRPAAKAASATAIAESWLAADSLLSLRAALGCLQALTHLWVGLHRAAAESAEGFSFGTSSSVLTAGTPTEGADTTTADGTTAGGTQAASGGGPVAAFGDEARALRLLEVIEVGFAVYPAVRCLPALGQPPFVEEADASPSKEAARAAAAVAESAAAAFAATLQCVVHCSALPRCAWPSTATRASAVSLLRRRLLRPCCFLPLASISGATVLPLLFRALRRSAMMLLQVHEEARAAAAASTAEAAAADSSVVEVHFLGPLEADELTVAALFHAAAADGTAAQAAAECLLSLLPLLGLPQSKQGQQQQGLLQLLTEALKREFESLGLLPPKRLLRGDEEHSLPCACCCALHQPDRQLGQQQPQSFGLYRQPEESPRLLEVTGSFFYHPRSNTALDREKTAGEEAAVATVAEARGRNSKGASLVGRSLLLQRLLQPVLQCLLFSEWRADLERSCCLCDVNDDDPFASELEAVGEAQTQRDAHSSSESGKLSDSKGSLNRSRRPSTSGSYNGSNSSSSSTACSSNSRILDAHSLMMRDPSYRESRRLCLRICHLLQCCRFYFPAVCNSITVPPHPAEVLHREQAASRRRQRRVDWLFFGSLTSGADAETATERQRKKALGKASVADLPGMTRDTALRAIDGVGIIRTVAEFFGHNDDEDDTPEKQASPDETDCSEAESEMRETPALMKWRHMQFFLSRPPGADLPSGARPINPFKQQQQHQQQSLLSAFAPRTDQVTTSSQQGTAPLLSVSCSPVTDDEALLQMQQALQCFSSCSGGSKSSSMLKLQLFLCAAVTSASLTQALSDLCHLSPLCHHIDSPPLLIAQGLASSCCRQIIGLITMRSPSSGGDRAAAAGKTAGRSSRGVSDAAAVSAPGKSKSSSANAAAAAAAATAAAAERQLEEERAVAAVALMGLRHLSTTPKRQPQQPKQQQQLQQSKEAATAGAACLTAAPTATPSPEKDADEAKDRVAVSL